MNAALEFLSHGDWEQDLFLLRVALGPQIKLMSQTLKADSQENELEDIHSCLEQGNRNFNIVRLCQGDHTRPMLRECCQILLSDNLWCEFACTEQHQSKLLQACSRSAAFVWRLLVLRLTSMPYALSALLIHRTHEMAAQLLDTPLCQQDEFSRKFLLEFDSPEKLVQEDCQQRLASAAFMIRTSTFFVERCHSQHSRLAKNRVQTQQMQAHSMAMPRAAAACVSWLQPAFVGQVAKESKKLGRPKKRYRDEAGVLADPPTKARRGGGGQWRAFLKERFAGQTLPTRDAAEMAAASAEYQRLDEQARARLRRIGLAGRQKLPQ